MTPPRVPDDARFFLFQPWRGTLYGSQGTPRQWLRVLEAGAYSGQVMESRVTGPDAASQRAVTTDVVTTVDMAFLLRAMSYGASDYVETGVTCLDDLNGLADVYSEPRLFMTEAMLRSYDARVRTLLGIARGKVGRVSPDRAANAALMSELRGCLVLWRQLMDTGGISPWRCLAGDRVGPDPTGDLGRLVEDAEREAESLRDRATYGSHVRMPFKIEEFQREALLGAYGIAAR